MIIREVIQILDKTIYRNHSDSGFKIRNRTNGTLWTEVNSSIDFEYEETEEKVEEETQTQDVRLRS